MGSKPFPFEMGPRRKRKFNEILGVGLLKLSYYAFGRVHNPLDASPQEAAFGEVLKIVNGNEKTEEPEHEDNLKAAMDAVMNSEPMTRRANTKSEPGKPATKQFLLRMTQDEHDRWRSFSDSLGVSMAEMVREAVRLYISEKKPDPGQCDRTDCKIVAYPWGTTVCQQCKKQWRD